MNPTEKARLTEAGRAEYISLLPVTDRHEIVGQSLALAAGATIPAHQQNPLAKDLLRTGTSLQRVMDALGGDVRAAVTSGDLASAISESLRHLVIEARRTRDISHRQICRMISLPDFKPQAVPGPQPVSLVEVPEAREIPVVTPAVTWETTAEIKTYAGLIPFTRQAIINAQWDLLGTIAAELVDAALRQERDAVFALLASNPNMTDGTPWFDASRNNISGTTGAPSVSTLEAAVSALRRLGGSGIALGLPPAYLVIPDTLEIATSVILEAGAKVVFSASSPALAASSLSSAWYILPSPTTRPVIGLAHLPNGTEPTVDLRPKFTSDGMFIRCRHSFSVMPLSPYGIQVPI